jgi:outer membrane protein OmpA-like peptidoglycan-associated protein
VLGKNFDRSQPQTAESLASLLELLAELHLLEENGVSEVDNLPSKTEKEASTATENKPPPSSPPPSPAPQPPLTAGREKREEIKFPASWTAPTPSPESVVRQRLASLEAKLAHLEEQVYQPTELINPLLPLIRELLSLKTGESKAAILEAIAPVLDEIIRQRGRQAPQKMEAALAPLLPGAITQTMADTPQAIARAIAPEIALALVEQSRLQKNSLANALGPEMGRAIKVQIKEEQEAMVDALYPVIGNTVSKYMVEVIKSVNEKVETALSLPGIQRRIRAKLQGVSEAELILQEVAADFTVQGIFLIHKASGLLLWEAQPDEKLTWESDLLAGMLTAMQNFVRDCVATPGQMSDLHEIDYDDAKIILEVAGYCYLAAVVKGEPSKPFLANLRYTLGQIVLYHGEAMAAFDGNRAILPTSAQFLLEKLTEPAAKQKANKPPVALLLLLLLPLLAVGFWCYRAQVASRLEARVTAALDAEPQLSVYRLMPEVRQGKLKLVGRVPAPYLRQLAAEVAQKTAPNLELENQIAAVNLPLAPGMAAAQRQQAMALFNLLNFRFYFAFGSSQLTPEDISSKIPSLAQFLAQNLDIHLQIIGHSDAAGKAETKRQLALARAEAVREALIARGVEPGRLHSVASLSLPPGLAVDAPDWLRRCVRFATFLSPAVTKK